MKATRPLLLLVSALAVAACTGLGPLDGENTTENVDLLVIPPDDSNLPAQVVPALAFSTLQSSEFDLRLSAGRTFAGLVTGTDGVGLANATVRITMKGAGLDATRVTDSAGRIAIPLGPGEYDVEVTPDRIDHYDVPPRIFRNVTVPDGDVQLPYSLTMPKGIPIRGKVLAPSGTPLLGYRVSARNAAGDPSTWGDTTVAGFQIFVSSTGDWIVQVTPPNGTGAPIAQKTIPVAPEGSTLDFQYEYFAPRTISGQIAGLGPMDPQPAASGITVRARSTLPSAETTTTYALDQRTTTDAQGHFALPVLSGIYTLTIEPPLDSPWSHRVIANVDATTADVTLDPAQTQLFPKVELMGRVIAEETAQGSAGARVALLAADGTAYSFTDRSEAGGAFEMLVDLGTYSVLVLPSPDSGLVRHVQSLEVASTTANVDFPLRTGFKVGGRVLAPTTDEPLANVTVMALRSSDKQPVGSAESLTEADGTWILTLPLAE